MTAQPDTQQAIADHTVQAARRILEGAAEWHTITEATPIHDQLLRELEQPARPRRRSWFTRSNTAANR